MKTLKRYLKYGGFLAPPVLVAVAWMHAVPTAVTEEDARFIHAILEEQGQAGVLDRIPVTFEEQIRAILAVQDAVLAHAPENKGLPQGSVREPRALFDSRYGACYDRSRTIEKALVSLGFDTRHIAVYSTDETGSTLVSLVTPQIRSHAVSEVKTSRGWLVVGSNTRWIALDADGRPHGIADLRAAAASQSPPHAWSSASRAEMSGILLRPFTYVIGLYSRHGGFYPPFTPVPDVNWRDFSANILPR